MKIAQSDEFKFRARKVVPGGIYGHASPAAGSGISLIFGDHAQGSRFVDVDGNEWLDFMCGFGAILHGYNHPEIEEAVTLQREKGSVFNQPSSLMSWSNWPRPLLPRLILPSGPSLLKNGSDLTTWAIRVARESTGRPLVISAKGAYHGVDSWCDPGHGGRIPDDRASIIEFEGMIWNLFADHVRKRRGNRGPCSYFPSPCRLRSLRIACFRFLGWSRGACRRVSELY